MDNIKLIKIFSLVISVLLLLNVTSAGFIASDVPLIDVSMTVENSEVALTSASLDTSGASMGKFYSDYSAANLYMGTPGESADDSLLHRANCYGYAFRFFYAQDDESLDNAYNAYKQQPGEFAYKNGLPLEYEVDQFEYMYDWGDVGSFLNEQFYSINVTDSHRLWMIEQLIKADAITLGYTVTEYTGTTVPDAQLYGNKRLIAVVVGDFLFEQNGDWYYGVDYHFYMQHSDNTWSHKPGEGEPMNVCLDHEVELTNDNIRNHVCEEKYSGGEVKFYYITKNAISDYRHLLGKQTNSTKTQVINSDLAGDYIFAAKDIGTLPEDYMNGNIDYVGDVDYYSFTSEYTEYRMFSFETPSSQPPVIMKIYDGQGDCILSLMASGQSPTVGVDLIESQTYYISFECPTQTDYVYNQIIYTLY